MNKINYHIILIFWTITSAGTAQNVETYFENQKPVSFEKLYLHTDREFYFQNDTLWFAAYLVDGQQHTQTVDACNLYVDIINAQGKVVQDELFIIQNGWTSGYVSLIGTSVYEGNYLLRAYTDYLKNFGDDAFFTKTIRVSSIKNSFEVALEKQAPPVSALPDTSDHRLQLNSESAGEQPSIDVSFLPEGGFLLAEESNCVTFKAIDENGKGVDISGELLDEQDNLVLTFNSIYMGAGKFYFYPKAGKIYTAIIDGINTEFQLPATRETDVKLKLINQEKEIIQLMVHGQARTRDMPYYLTCMHQGTGLFFTEVSWEKLNSVLRFTTNQLGAGINRFVLLNKNLQPVSERLVFNYISAINTLNIELSEETYSTREEVQLNIRSADKFINDLAQVSVAVVDQNYINSTGVSQNISSHLLLNSELKGHIEAPASYLDSDEELSAQTKLDLLMTTNGWSNYIWNFLKPETITPDINPQLGFTFKGNVKRGLSNKTLEEGSVSMIVKSDSTTQFLDQSINENGQFEFQKIVYYDTASVFAQARNKRDKHSVKFEMQRAEFIKPEINISALNQLSSFSSIPLSVYRQRYLNEMRSKEFNLDMDNILLEEIKIAGRKPEPKIKTGIPIRNQGAYELTSAMTAGSTNILEYLINKVPNVRGIYTKGILTDVSVSMGAGLSGQPGPAGFFLDGFIYFSGEDIKSFNVDDFKSIEILTPPGSNFYGARGINGAVILTFKTGDEIAASRPLLGGVVERLKGFAPLREFYSPKYTPENISSDAPDYRNTLYWNPDVRIQGGEYELFFYTCDNITRYKVFVEGITQNGQVCLGEAKIEVNSYNPINKIE